MQNTDSKTVKVISNILSCQDHPEQFTFCCCGWWWIKFGSDLVEAKEVGVGRMGQLPGMGHVYVHPVILLQLNGRAQVTLCGPRVTWPQRA